ncbi:MAG: hypothetical protein A3C06_01865 [Candidatus Taylorbacteria bacterium RIFCSPHIGHO2_02_FULL_46_13]|uniref:Peptidase M14 domain-containing protein n=1 Tax=Candidatus Taylorbacteria bacterium RIFCSPHIGHO2_02_FULL_46_13 TaxID=1802312 RepID=A0A1G2MPX5_9BACT|nr:MAG: hypothetical protein A3C06_01865 [Candidatus Taylorbacteria bacterium RIFCSPHIGHO2_02_FULL_46_13]
MRPHVTKPLAVIVLILTALGIGVFTFVSLRKTAPEIQPAVAKDLSPKHTIIGQSVLGRDIGAYTYGNGATHLVFVGGMHGGYEWNSVLLAYTFMDYLDANPDAIPDNLTVTVIPSVNPDGVYKVVGKSGRFTYADISTNQQTLVSGRFNANTVDLNRNFDCKWKPESMWQTKTVSGGSAAFSEPETKAIRNFILENNPRAVIFWHSQSNAVYASACQDGILPETLAIMNAYSDASGYPAVKTFDAYETTGAADDWLASVNIPSITVELKTHDTIEWNQNLAGIKALFGYYGYDRGEAQ